ncbi:potassium channel, sub T, member 2 [Physocladia obscura]|uniref:Potassium channel, sub T, member 2 n=1 Tax=Physocladia obscura TaxID=109957 RepID=A0AAD5T1Z0_9FUNG|nr:potassium channel, sub T, member 2 [Physocladia obscura]
MTQFLVSEAGTSEQATLSMRHSKVNKLLDTLGAKSLEMQSARQSMEDKAALMLNMVKPEVKSYKYVRDALRSNQPIGQTKLSSSLSVLSRFAILGSFFASEGCKIAFTILDLISDLFFCTLYLFDIQWALSHEKDPNLSGLPGPSYFWISRLPETFTLCVAFSIFIAVSWCYSVAFADNRIRAVFSALTLTNILTALPFIVSVQISEARYLYIPYFLRAIVAVDRLQKVLRLRGATTLLKFGVVMEKVIMLLGTMIAIVYLALCLFQYVEFRFGNRILNIFDSFYFVVVTLSTVGYGDIAPQTREGELVVVILIFAALTVLPSLIGELLSAIAERRGGHGGVYSRGNANYFVVLGNFENELIMSDVLDGILHEQSTNEKVVILARSAATPKVTEVVSDYKYKNCVTYLVGSGMKKPDLERAQVKHASAVYVLGDRGASDRRREDERNTLRVWAIRNYAPDVPIFVRNLLPDSEPYQEMTVDASICVGNLKQLILGLTVIHTASSESSYETLWEAQYGDGFGNEIFVVPMNPVFAGTSFNEASCYVFAKLQLNMIGVRVYSMETDSRIILLNPGKAYILANEDEVVLVSQTESDASAFSNLASISLVIHQTY